MFEWLEKQPALQGVIQWYQQLEARDKKATNILAGFLAVVLIVFGMIMPAANFQSAAIKDHHKSKEDLAWIEANKHLVIAGGAVASRNDGQSLLGVANTTSRSYQINFKRYEPAGENGLNLWIEGALFNNVMRWLERIEKKHQITVQDISIDKQDADGVVNVRLMLRG